MAKILCVDNEAPMRRLFSRFVSRAGHEAVLAGNMPEAVRAYQAGGIDAVLTDYDYEHEDGTGVDLAEYLQGQRPDLPVMIITGSVYAEHRKDETVLEAARRVGVIGILEKPIDFKPTLDIIKGIATRDYSLIEQNANHYFPENTTSF